MVPLKFMILENGKQSFLKNWNCNSYSKLSPFPCLLYPPLDSQFSYPIIEHTPKADIYCGYKLKRLRGGNGR